MRSKKNKFFTFIFSLIPGAGEMYMGFKKMGLSIMCLLMGMMAIAFGLGVSLILLAVAIVWFYSFFNVHNIASLSDEQFELVEDEYILPLGEMEEINKLLKGKMSTWISLGLIFVGVIMLFQTFISILYRLIPDFMYDYLSFALYNIPKIVAAFAVIALGLYLFNQKKKQIQLEAKERSEEVAKS